MDNQSIALIIYYTIVLILWVGWYFLYKKFPSKTLLLILIAIPLLILWIEYYYLFPRNIWCNETLYIQNPIPQASYWYTKCRTFYDYFFHNSGSLKIIWINILLTIYIKAIVVVVIIFWVRKLFLNYKQ